MLWDTFWCKWQGDNVRHPLFCFVLFYHIKISQTMALHATLLLSSESSSSLSLSMSRVASTWFETKCLELRCGSYWLLNHFLNNDWNQKSKLKTALESPQLVTFNRVYFTIFRAKVVWKILIFLEWILMQEI